LNAGVESDTRGSREERPVPDPGRVPSELEDVVRRALDEDLGGGDVTTASVIGEAANDTLRAKADLVFRERAVVAGLPAAEAAFRIMSVESRFTRLARDGDTVEAGAVAATVSGPAGAVLSAERVALNFVGRLSGVATLTSQFVEAVAGTGARILDTRKTTPLLRALEKYAVRGGGGVNHRMGLYDAILVKDNHLALAGLTAAEAVRRVKKDPGILVEVEVERVEDALDAARAGADIILLDNFDPAAAGLAIAGVRAEFARGGKHSPQIEVSGGVTLQNVRKFAEAGADRISIGALTHSARAVDVSLDIVLK
jgi:nicotinate-nucleotide pyrophosphorylase (carboxylating)